MRRITDLGLDGQLRYNTAEDIRPSYNLILTGVAFLHAHYHEAFSRLPLRLVHMIDEEMNCEDIAINFVASSICNCTAGLFSSKGSKKSYFVEHNSGLAGRKNHYNVRTRCCRIFSKELGVPEIKLKSIYSIMYSLKNKGT